MNEEKSKQSDFDLQFKAIDAEWKREAGKSKRRASTKMEEREQAILHRLRQRRNKKNLSQKQARKKNW